jgi:hypothetical protein
MLGERDGTDYQNQEARVLLDFHAGLRVQGVFDSKRMEVKDTASGSLMSMSTQRVPLPDSTAVLISSTESCDRTAPAAS